MLCQRRKNLAKAQELGNVGGVLRPVAADTNTPIPDGLRDDGPSSLLWCANKTKRLGLNAALQRNSHVHALCLLYFRWLHLLSLSEDAMKKGNTAAGHVGLRVDSLRL